MICICPVLENLKPSRTIELLERHNKCGHTLFRRMRHPEHFKDVIFTDQDYARAIQELSAIAADKLAHAYLHRKKSGHSESADYRDYVALKTCLESQHIREYAEWKHAVQSALYDHIDLGALFERTRAINILQRAVLANDLEFTRWLLEHGADVLLPTAYRKTSIIYKSTTPEMAKLLMQHGALPQDNPATTKIIALWPREAIKPQRTAALLKLVMSFPEANPLQEEKCGFPLLMRRVRPSRTKAYNADMICQKIDNLLDGLDQKTIQALYEKRNILGDTVFEVINQCAPKRVNPMNVYDAQRIENHLKSKLIAPADTV